MSIQKNIMKEMYDSKEKYTPNVENEKVLDLINETNSDEELEELGEAILREAENKKPTADNSDSVNKEEVEPKEENKKDISEDNNEIAPEIAPIKDKQADKVTPLVISDEYISKAPEEDRKILAQVKGEVFSEKALKTYINAQHLIGKKQVPLTEVTKEQAIPKQEIPEGYKEILDAEVITELKRQYPDLPNTIDSKSDEYKEFLRDLNYDNPEEAIKFLNVKERVAKEKAEQFEKVIYVKNNYGKINSDLLVSELSNIKSRLEKYGVTPEALGINLNTVQNNQFLDDFIKDSNGSLDPELVQYLGDGQTKVPLLRKGSIEKKFIDNYFDKIITHLKSESRREGFQTANDKKSQLPNTLASNNTTGRGVAPISLEEVLNSNDSDFINKQLEKLEKEIK